MNIVNKLLKSPEPVIRYKILTGVLGEDLNSQKVKALQKEIKNSRLIKILLSEQDKEGKIPYHPYRKWRGAHWILSLLADLNYPPDDQSLIPLRETTFAWLLSKNHEAKIKLLKGKFRRCASQEGNFLYSLLKLGLTDGRTSELAKRLIKWQWPDGGWNCDQNPKAQNSSFMESLIPLRALGLYAKLTGNKDSLMAAKNAAEIFLKRKLYQRQSTGEIIFLDFTLLHYPCYWHYDILFGLKVMAETGFIKDERCQDALQLLLAKQLPDGSFPAEAKYYQTRNPKLTSYSPVDWGPVAKNQTNEFVTADALFVLKEANL